MRDMSASFRTDTSFSPGVPLLAPTPDERMYHKKGDVCGGYDERVCRYRVYEVPQLII